MHEEFVSNRLEELINPKESRSSCVEYGTDGTILYEDHLYNYEAAGWNIICMQEDPEKYMSISRHRRLCKHIVGETIDEFLLRTNITEIKILLVKSTEDTTSVISGFSPLRWGTEIICIGDDNQRKEENEKILLNSGFKLSEKVAIYAIYTRDHSPKVKENTDTKDTIENIFSV